MSLTKKKDLGTFVWGKKCKQNKTELFIVQLSMRLASFSSFAVSLDKTTEWEQEQTLLYGQDLNCNSIAEQGLIFLNNNMVFVCSHSLEVYQRLIASIITRPLLIQRKHTNWTFFSSFHFICIPSNFSSWC